MTFQVEYGILKGKYEGKVNAMIKAVIFDLDGTLANTISALREVVNLTMKKYGYPTHTDADILRFINNGARELIRRAMPQEKREDEALVSQVLEDYGAAYQSVCLLTDRTYDGIPEVIRELREKNGLKIGVLSNKQDAMVRMLIGQLLPKGSCDWAQGVTPTLPTKPDPVLSRRVAEALGVLPEECVMVGDSDVDIRTATLAGMHHIGVSWGYRDEAFLREHGAARIAHSPCELIPMIKSMMNKENVKGSLKHDQD